MKELYHFSHFLEFLCGVYFGGFALLSFFQKDALKTFDELIIERTSKENETRVMSGQYFKTRATTPEIGILRYLIHGFAWVSYILLDRFFRVLFVFASRLVKKVNSATKEDFIKKFFPAFFFSGCFCLVMVILSAFQMENDNKVCAAAVDRFGIYYGASTIVFQIWALFIFPFLVNKIDYFHLTLISIFLSLAMMWLSISHACHNGMDLHMDWIFSVQKGEWIKVALLLIALIPLLLVLLFSILTMLLWELPVIFFGFWYFMFKRSGENDPDINAVLG